MKITDENNATIGVFCGVQNGKEVLIGGSYLMIILNTLDAHNDYDGFWISFTAGLPSKFKRNENDLDKPVCR